MAVVTLLVDPYRLVQPAQGALLVESIAGYVPACVALREALHGGQPVVVCVRERTVEAWLHRWAMVYGEGKIRRQMYRPRDVLRDRWGIDVPAAVEDRDILDAGLLDSDVTPREGQAFWDVLLEYYFGEALTYRTLPAGRIPALAELAVLDDWKESLSHPLLVRALRDRLAQWSSATRSDSLRVLIQELENDPEGLRRDLAAYKLLRSYPAALGSKVMGDRWDLLAEAKVDTAELSLSQADRARVLPDIEYYLSKARTKVESRTDLEALIGEVSGELVEEFKVISQLVRDHPEWLDQDLLQQTETCFRPIRSGISTLLANLRRLIPPTYPGNPDKGWSASEWLAWITGRYMPYYTWLDLQGSYDETVASFASTFADWFYERFMELKNGEPEHFAFTALYDERERIAGGDASTLVVILDNFNYSYMGVLTELLAGYDYSVESSQPVFSLVPTATEVSKPCIIAGRGDAGEVDDAGYPKLIASEWNPVLKGKTAGYLATVGDLQDLQDLRHALYFLNFIQIDTALHTDNRQTGQPHADTVRERLTALVDAVAQFAQRFRIESRLNLYFIADHGSTRIQKGVVNVLDKDFYKGVALDKHHRYIAVSNTKFEDLPQVAEAQCYKLGRDRFKTSRNYLVAREYYRFVETTENFYVHGGLTPEEVVVPFVRAAHVEVVPLEPTMRLLATQFRPVRESRVPVEVGNPNGFSIEQLSLRLLDADSDEWQLPSLPAKQSVKAELKVKFKKLAGTSKTRLVTLRLRYVCQGRAFGPVDRTFEITVKPLMEETDDSEF
jgi:hypothetical protein